MSAVLLEAETLHERGHAFLRLGKGRGRQVDAGEGNVLAVERDVGLHEVNPPWTP